MAAQTRQPSATVLHQALGSLDFTCCNELEVTIVDVKTAIRETPPHETPLILGVGCRG